jgi:hypothetical protein
MFCSIACRMPIALRRSHLLRAFISNTSSRRAKHVSSSSPASSRACLGRGGGGSALSFLFITLSTAADFQYFCVHHYFIFSIEKHARSWLDNNFIYMMSSYKACHVAPRQASGENWMRQPGRNSKQKDFSILFTRLHSCGAPLLITPACRVATKSQRVNTGAWVRPTDKPYSLAR